MSGGAIVSAVPASSRYHRIDGWRGYSIPRLAIVGASDTGTWADSPCPTPAVKAELARFQREALRPAGIRSRQLTGNSTNVFCGKRWLTVRPEDYPRAAQIAVDWIEDNDFQLHYLHTADLEDVGYKATTGNG